MNLGSFTNTGLFRLIRRSIYSFFESSVNQIMEIVLPYLIMIIQFVMMLVFILSTSFFITVYITFITIPISTIKHPVYFDYMSNQPNGK